MEASVFVTDGCVIVFGNVRIETSSCKCYRLWRIMNAPTSEAGRRKASRKPVHGAFSLDARRCPLPATGRRR